MSFFDFDFANFLANIEPHVEIKCVVTDLNNPDVRKNMDYIFGGIEKEKNSPARSTFDRNVSRVKRTRSINVDFITAFPHISYFAIDYKEQTEFSFIQAKHYLIAEYTGEVNVYYCIVRPGAKLYEYYRKQIILLEKKGEQTRG